MRKRNVLAIVALVCSIVVLGVHAAPTPPTASGSGHATRVPPPPTLEHFIYSNSDGVFDANPASSGFATYNWNSSGHGYSDTLAYTMQLSLPVGGGQMSANVFEATDGTNVWYLAFGTSPIGADGNGRNVFPIWYSFTPPPATGGFQRWTTPTGTNRKKILP